MYLDGIRFDTQTTNMDTPTGQFQYCGDCNRLKYKDNTTLQTVATLKDIQDSQNVYGQNYKAIADRTLSVTTLDIFQPKLYLNTDTGLVGIYNIRWEACFYNADKVGEIRLRNLTDSEILGPTFRWRLKDGASLQLIFMNRSDTVALTGGAKTFLMEWRADNGGEQEISWTNISMWRVK